MSLRLLRSTTPSLLRTLRCGGGLSPHRLAPSGRRYVGEQTGLSAIADRAASVRRHDPLLPSVGDTMVDAYSSTGLTINGVLMPGAVLLLPKASFLFTVEHPGDLTVKSLSVLELLDSPIGMLVIGCGRRARRVPSDVCSWLVQRGAAVESLATPHACSTFNFMVQDQREVAAVLFPVGAETSDNSRDYRH